MNAKSFIIGLAVGYALHYAVTVANSPRVSTAA